MIPVVGLEHATMLEFCEHENGLKYPNFAPQFLVVSLSVHCVNTVM